MPKKNHAAKDRGAQPAAAEEAPPTEEASPRPVADDEAKSENKTEAAVEAKSKNKTEAATPSSVDITSANDEGSATAPDDSSTWSGAGSPTDDPGAPPLDVPIKPAAQQQPSSPPGPPMHLLTRRLCVPLLSRGLASIFEAGTVRLVLPDGRIVLFGDGGSCGPTQHESTPMPFGESNNGLWHGCESVTVRVSSERALWRVLADPAIGLGEAVVAGELTLEPDARDFFHTFLWNASRARAVDKPAVRFDGSLLARSISQLTGKLWNDALALAILRPTPDDGMRRSLKIHSEAARASHCSPREYLSAVCRRARLTHPRPTTTTRAAARVLSVAAHASRTHAPPSTHPPAAPQARTTTSSRPSSTRRSAARAPSTRSRSS
jgi:hypothetical protein